MENSSAIVGNGRVTTVAELEALYGPANTRSLLKELDYISDHYRAFIEHAPFVAVATCGPEGMDCSPRGDPPGFVRVHDRKTVMMPDRRGNNRLDTLKNIVRDPRIALLFLVPGVNEALRINGTAIISTEPALCESFAMGDKLPRSVIVVSVDRVYYQCQKALVRSKLWSMDAQVQRSALPTAGQMLEPLCNGEIEATTYDAQYPEHLKKTIY